MSGARIGSTIPIIHSSPSPLCSLSLLGNLEHSVCVGVWKCWSSEEGVDSWRKGDVFSLHLWLDLSLNLGDLQLHIFLDD